MKKKAFVLLSGGLDSTTCLYQAMCDLSPIPNGEDGFMDWVLNAYDHTCDWVEAVSIFYGQRHKRELTFAAKTCERFNIKHTILDVGDLLKGKNILLSADSIGTMNMVHTSYDQIQGVSPSYVPFRNGLLLSAITAHAQKYVNEQIDAEVEDMVRRGFSKEGAKILATAGAKDLVTIYYGAHAEDAANWAYPDCTPEFNGSMANAIYTGTYNTIRLATPLQWSKKHEIVTKGNKLGVEFSDTWSCYDNGEVHCGKCPTCLARKEAFRLANVHDTTTYLSEQADYRTFDDEEAVPF